MFLTQKKCGWPSQKMRSVIELNIHQNILISDSINFIDKRVRSNFYDIIIKENLQIKL